MDVHFKVRWKLKKMRASVRICHWEMTLNQAWVQVRSITTLKRSRKHFFTHPFPDDKHLSLFSTLPSPLCFPPPPTHYFPHPPIIPLCPSFSMDEWWYSRGIVEEESFPGPVASSSQIKQGTCSDHLTLGSVMKPSDRNSHALLVHTFPFHMLLYTCSLSLCWHHARFSSCICFYVFCLFASSCAICKYQNLL